MKICILDGYSLNPGDLDWSPVERLGDVTLFDRTPADKIVERAADADIVLTNKVPFSADTLRQLPRLRFICVLATGYNIIDTEAAARQGVVVANIPAYSTMSVAQMAFAHILNITNHVASYAREVADGKWTNCPDFCFWDSALTELAGKTMGIVGLGNTGMATARIAVAMGMKVVALTSKSADTLPEGITPAPLDDVLASADVVSLHCPLTPSTRHLINAASIAKMKPSAILINTGRGPLVDEQAVADALNGGRLAAFGADVLSQEPPRGDNPLLSARNCFLTPHIAWATLEARTRLMSTATENVRQFIAGEPVANRVN
ncbi:MAG TPA: glycerate dehydrogenase [Porphyromonadaceae bacterium]|jgi:glycerate dehydrogenase|uniref:D-2-hydroxyacid dehydrogenase n=1 Tax=Candidatus Limisoma sp. TaxID=3076476 RepID=UPI000EE59B7D|nr:D-2-hydroxyacid dehydrogenase [Porphyromonadaceae bacterium]HAM94229.1 glycerate dehydrogenase [Porphyromonadaceae bacterium]